MQHIIDIYLGNLLLYQNTIGCIAKLTIPVLPKFDDETQKKGSTDLKIFLTSFPILLVKTIKDL